MGHAEGEAAGPWHDGVSEFVQFPVTAVQKGPVAAGPQSRGARGCGAQPLRWRFPGAAVVGAGASDGRGGLGGCGYQARSKDPSF